MRTDSNTHSVSPDTDPIHDPDMEYAVRGPRPRGFTMVYHETSVALSRATMTATAYRAYFYLCSKADQYGVVYPKQSTIGEHLGVNQSAVSKAMHELESGGFLTITHRTRDGKRGINLYQLRDDQTAETDPAELSNIPPRNMEIFPHGIAEQDVLNNTHKQERARTEKTDSAPRVRNQSRSKVPTNWWPDGPLRVETEARGWTPERIADEVPRFVQHHRAKGNLLADIRAAWRLWVGNGLRFDERDNAKARAATSTTDYADDEARRWAKFSESV